MSQWSRGWDAIVTLRTASRLYGNGVYRTVSSLRAAWLTTAGAAGDLVLAAVPGKAEIVGIISAPILLLMTWRFWICGARVEENGVKVCDWWSTKRIAWADIDKFTLEPSGGYPYVGRILRKDRHRPVVIVGISTGRRKTEKHRLQAQAPIDLLNEALQSWRGAHDDGVETSPT